jgi:hypothetical protein
MCTIPKIRSGHFIQEAAYVPAGLRQQDVALIEIIFLAGFCLPAILFSVLLSFGLLQL